MANQQEGTFGTLEPIGGGDPIPLMKQQLVIGRRETCDICLRFSNVSTKHCELVLEQGYWKVRDLQSTNGVKVNGERVFEKRVYPGDELTISKTHRFRLDYTPTKARSADVEVDELHADIMRFSLLERAGLTKQGDKAKTAPRRPKTDDDAKAIEFLGHTPVAKPAGEHDDHVDMAKPAGKSSSSLSEEDDIESVSPATSAHDLSDDEFLKIVAEEEAKKKAKKQS